VFPLKVVGAKVTVGMVGDLNIVPVGKGICCACTCEICVSH
jgi:hypothetical protein